MITLLAKLFIKDYHNYKNQQVRQKYGILSGSLGIFLNILLFIAKIIFGLLSASVAMIADAFNNLSDAASSIIELLGFKLAAKKPDKEHPFGHGRIEYVSGLMISFLIIILGVNFVKTSFMALLHPEPVHTNLYTVLVLVIAIAVKFYMYVYNSSIGKKIDSVALKATATDSLGDMVSEVAVILSVVIAPYTSLPVDGIAGLIVAGFIIYTGIESANETLKPLLGLPPTKDFVDQIENELLSHENIIGMHDLVVHDYGPGRKMISLHAEVPGDIDVFKSHDIIDIAEAHIAAKFDCHVVIHMDPIDTKNEQLVVLKELALKEAQKFDPQITIHDVRMVPGPTHTNLIFDLVKPFSCTIPNEELVSRLRKNINDIRHDVFCVIQIDAPYVSE